MLTQPSTCKFDTHIVTRAAGGGRHALQRCFEENSTDEPVQLVYHEETLGVIFKPASGFCFLRPEQTYRRESSLKSRAAERLVKRFGPISSLVTTEEVSVKPEERVDTTEVAKPKRRSKGQANTDARKLAAALPIEIGNPSPAIIDLTVSSSNEDKQRGKTGGRVSADATW